MLGNQTGPENGFPLAISDCKTIDRILERRMPFSSLYPSTSIHIYHMSEVIPQSNLQEADKQDEEKRCKISPLLFCCK